jgi:hypothetical protein
MTSERKDASKRYFVFCEASWQLLQHGTEPRAGSKRYFSITNSFIGKLIQRISSATPYPARYRSRFCNGAEATVAGFVCG